MDDEKVEAVEPQEPVMDLVEEVEQAHDEALQETEQEPKHVPLSALQKERKKRQELEYELQMERQKHVAPPVDDSSKYESATREDLSKAQLETIRAVDERIWIRSNPDKFEEINELLPEFLKQRPNLARAINDAPNRYEEAYTLMKALSPKQQKQLVKTPKKEAPGAPTSVPKAASLNEAVDVMKMSDSEYLAWRKSQKKR